MAVPDFLLHLNLEGYSDNKMCELRYTLEHLKPIAVSLNETWLCPTGDVQVAGYQVFRRDRLTGARGGVIVLVRQDIPAAEVDAGQLADGNEAVVVDLFLNPRKLRFVSLYCRPTYLTDTALLARLATGDTVVMGDLNAKDPELRSRGANAAGAAFVQWLNQSNLMLLSDGTATHTSRIHNTSDQLDLVLCTVQLVGHMEVPAVGDDLGSDHLPVLVAIQTNHETPQEADMLWFDTRRFDKPRYQASLMRHFGDQAVAYPRNATQICALDDRISSAISAAANETVPKRSPREIQTWHFTPAIAEAVRNRRICRREWQRTRDPAYNESYRVWQRQRDMLIEDQKAVAADQLRIKLDARLHTSSRQFWADFRRLLDGNKAHRQSIPPIKEGDRWLTTNQEKADLFAEKLQSSLCSDGPDMDEQFKARVDGFVADKPALFEPNFELKDELDPLCVVSAADVKRAAQSLKNTAPGPDGMLNIFLRNASEQIYGALAILFQASLMYGYLPRSWKRAKTVMIEKPGKVRSSVKGWRPLSLTGVGPKLLERILAARILAWMEQRNLLPLHLTSFRGAHCTTDQLVRIVETVQKGFAKGHFTLAAFLDIDGAFNRVWHNGFRLKLAQMGLPVEMIRWLSHWLVDRSLFVHVGNAVSNPVSMLAGFIQGSPLSPVCFIGYTRDVPVSADPRCGLSIYADDFAVYATSKSARVAEIVLNAYLALIHLWCKQWRITLSPDKCKAVRFRDYHWPEPDPATVVLNGHQIPLVTQHRFLGLLLDNKLTMHAHVDDLRGRVTKRLQGVKALSALGRDGVWPRTAIHVYCAFVRSVIAYASPAWLHVSETRMGNLQVLQNDALRFALKAPPWSRIDLLHEAAGGLPSLRDHAENVAVQYWATASNRNPLMAKTLAEHDVWSQLFDRRTTISVVRDRIPHGPVHRLDIIRERERPAEWQHSIAKVLADDVIQ